MEKNGVAKKGFQQVLLQFNIRNFWIERYIFKYYSAFELIPIILSSCVNLLLKVIFLEIKIKFDQLTKSFDPAPILYLL